MDLLEQVETESSLTAFCHDTILKACRNVSGQRVMLLGVTSGVVPKWRQQISDSPRLNRCQTFVSSGLSLNFFRSQPISTVIVPGESPLGAPKATTKTLFQLQLEQTICDIRSPASRENPWFVHSLRTILQASRCAATKRRNNLAMNWVKQIFIEYLVMFSVFLTKSSYDSEFSFVLFKFVSTLLHYWFFPSSFLYLRQRCSSIVFCLR